MHSLLCHHEAAHAVIMLAQGDVIDVAIVEQAWDNTCGLVRAKHSTAGPDERAIASYAGLAAAALWLHRTISITFDRALRAAEEQDVGDIASAKHDLARPGASLRIHQVRHQAIEAVTAQWNAIGEVADALRQRGTLTGDDIVALLR
uniref:hypothetical protein n=1 Tax=Actinokineospora sp. CA-119265 TaxID=3239890 RepID=UPI003F49333A